MPPRLHPLDRGALFDADVASVVRQYAARPCRVCGERVLVGFRTPHPGVYCSYRCYAHF